MEVFTTLCILSLLVNASALPSSVEPFSGQISVEDIDFTDSSTTPKSSSCRNCFAIILMLNEQLLKRLETLENKIADLEVSNQVRYDKAGVSIKALKDEWNHVKGQVTFDEFSKALNDLSNILTSTHLGVLQLEKELISTGQNITHLQTNVSALLGGAGQKPTYPVSSSAGAAAESCGVSSILPQGCKEAQNHTGIIKVAPSGHQSTSFYVNCHNGWTIIQQRKDGSIDFYRPWLDYKHGFGNINGEFWIGLDKLHELTSSRLHELLIYLEDFDGLSRTAKYDAFAIGGEKEKYAIVLLGNYSGDAGDSFSYSVGQKFSTFDNDNDSWEGNCANFHTSAWWYKDCSRSNLNGRYLGREVSQKLNRKGIYWNEFKGERNSFKAAVMLIRPVGRRCRTTSCSFHHH